MASAAFHTRKLQLNPILRAHAHACVHNLLLQLLERQAELLPAPYFHVVYTLPARIADIAYQNKAAIYGILFKASAETTLRIAAARASGLSRCCTPGDRP